MQAVMSGVGMSPVFAFWWGAYALRLLPACAALDGRVRKNRPRARVRYR